jgi:hypothetical protein
MYSLIVCSGMVVGSCVNLYRFNFPTQAECIEQQRHVERRLKDGWSVCIPASGDING